MMLPDISSSLVDSLLRAPIRPMLREPGGWGYLVYVQYRCLERMEFVLLFYVSVLYKNDRFVQINMENVLSFEIKAYPLAELNQVN